MNKFPIIKAALFFIIGIIAQKLFPNKFWVLFIIALFLALLSLIIHLLYKEKAKTFLALSLNLSFALIGALIYSNYVEGLKQYPFEILKYNNCNVFGTVKSVELIKEGRVIFNADIDSVVILSKSRKIRREFIVRIYEENNAALRKLYEKLKIGNKFSLEGSIQRARDKRNPGEFDYNNYLNSNNISGLVTAYNAGNISFIEAGGSFSDKINNLFYQWRKGIDNEIQRLHSKKVSALLRGLLLGDYKKIDEESIENWINAGVIHVLAVSGQHVALILLIFFFLFKRFNPYLKYAFAAVGLILFLFLTGNQPSVARAVIMGLFFISAVLLNRDRNVYNILALSALAILVFNPNELFNPGFQLSYSAVLSIVYLYPILKDRLNAYIIKPAILKKIILFGLVSFSAQIGTLPFTLAYFHKLSIAALIVNLFVIPLTAGIIYAGIVTLIISSFWGWGGVIFAAANSFLCSVTNFIVEYFGGASGSFFKINQFSFYDAFIYYSGLFVIIYIFNNYKKISAKLTALACIAVVMPLFMSLDNYAISIPGNLTVIAVDVGQGDATLIKFPDGKTGLIDAGNSFKNFSNGDKVILPLMDRMNIDSIDYAFITHLDADHYYGIFKLIEKGKIRSVFKPYPDSLNIKDMEFEKYLRLNNCEVNYFSYKIESIGGCRLYFLNHPKLNEGIKLSSNSKSMILKLVYGNNSFFFTGDADKAIEEKLVSASGKFLKSDVLKAGHHGGKSSSAESFVNCVKPEYVLISSGIENRFGHPSAEALLKFNKAGANILRTDKNGAVIINSDGNNISIMDWKKKESRFIFDL